MHSMYVSVCDLVCIVAKGQLISKYPFGVIVWTKIITKKFDKFLPYMHLYQLWAI